MISLEEAQELHELIGATLEQLRDDNLLAQRELRENLERAREIASLLVAEVNEHYL